MNEIYLLAESTKTAVPDAFSALVQNVLDDRSIIIKIDKPVLEIFSLDFDYIVCVFATVALECGFRLDESPSCNFDVREMRDFNSLRKWRDTAKKLYKVEFRLSQLQNYIFTLLVVPVFGNVAIVNFLTLKDSVVVRTKGDCMIPSQWLSLFQNSIAERFNNLPVLAKCCRSFFQSEKDMALNDENKPNPSLLGLPEEILIKILKYLSPKDFLQLTTCCKGFGRFAKNPAYWKFRLRIDYNLDSENPMDCYIAKFSTSKVANPSYPDFSEEFFPMLLTRATSSTTLGSLMPPYL